MVEKIKINYYDYFFYKMYKIYLKKYREIKSWHCFFMILIISAFEGMPLFVLILMFFHFKSFVISEMYIQFGILVPLYFINTKYFLSNKRWVTIIEKYKVYDNTKFSIRMDVIMWLLMALSFSSIVYWAVIVKWKLYF